MTMDSEIPGKTSPQGMHIQYLQKKNETVFENLSISTTNVILIGS